MRRLCPNLEREDALDTVFEVPLPEELFANMGTGGARWQNMRTWLKAQAFDRNTDSPPQLTGKTSEVHLLLNVVGSPLIPCAVPHDRAFSRSIRDSSIQASTAKYIIQQYIAATGGQQALTSVQSFYAVGKVKMNASDFHIGDDCVIAKNKQEIGGYVLYQKTPEIWFFEFLLGGLKGSAGSNGKLAWRQNATEQTHASRGPPRPLRRSLQGLDPRSTANLFSDAVCIGEKIIKGEECFILKLEASAAILKGRGAANFDIIRHTLWGYFSQRTGLLVQLDDTHLLRMKASGRRGESIFWETSMESAIEEYSYVDGVNIARAGRTSVTLFRYGEGSVNHRRKMEETWTIEEVGFNVWGLHRDCFLPPKNLKEAGDDEQQKG